MGPSKKHKIQKVLDIYHPWNYSKETKSKMAVILTPKSLIVVNKTIVIIKINMFHFITKLFSIIIK